MSGQDAGHRQYRFGDFVLDLERGALSRGGVDVKLRPKSFEVLRYLVENAGRLVGKRELMDAVWGRTVVTEGSLTQCIIDVRRALGDDGSRLLRTVPRRGFIFEGQVSIPPTLAGNTSGDNGVDDALSAPGPGIHTSPSTAPESTPPPARRRWPLPLLIVLGLLALAGGVWWLHQGREAGGRAAQAPEHATIPVRANSVAVLRFLDLSPDQSQAYLADGLGEEILHILAQSPDLLVIARSSSFVFEPGEADIATIASQLGVAYVLEGSVRRDGDRLRIVAQLIDTVTSAHVWSRSYDRNARDLLAVQREIAVDVARALRVSLAVDATDPGAVPPEAEDLYLHARYLFHRRGPGDLEAADTHVRRALEIDPGHARAWTLLAGVQWVWAIDDPGGRGTRLEEMRRALERALEIDPTLATAHVRLASYFRWFQGDLAAANAAFARAVELAPNDPQVLGYRWSQAVRDGRFAEAIEIGRRSLAADPLSGVVRYNVALGLLGAGEFEQGLAELYRARDLVPGNPQHAIDISRALLLLGRLDEARHEAATVEEGPDRDQLRVLLDADRDALARLESDGSARSLMLLAEIAAFQRDAETAFERLATLSSRVRGISALDEPLIELIDLRISPFLHSLHDDPRWEALLAELR